LQTRPRRPLILPYHQRRRLRGLPPAGHASHPFWRPRKDDALHISTLPYLL